MDEQGKPIAMAAPGASVSGTAGAPRAAAAGARRAAPATPRRIVVMKIVVFLASLYPLARLVFFGVTDRLGANRSNSSRVRRVSGRSFSCA